MNNREKILVVEDEPHIAEGIKLNLKLLGYTVKVVDDGLAAIEVVKSWVPTLVVLDLMLPGMDGFGVLKEIRKDNKRLPVLVLTAKDHLSDKIKCFSEGVDDYLTKPFHLEEFLLRIKRLVEKSSWSEMDQNAFAYEDQIYNFGGNSVDFNLSVAHNAKGEELKLTSQEIKLLKLFILQAGKPLSREELLKEGWDYESGMSTRTVDNFVVRLRKYFENDPKNPKHFISMRSVGYIFHAE